MSKRFPFHLTGRINEFQEDPLVKDAFAKVF